MSGTLLLISITRFWGSVLKEHKTAVKIQWFESAIKSALTPLTSEPDPLALACTPVWVLQRTKQGQNQADSRRADEAQEQRKSWGLVSLSEEIIDIIKFSTPNTGIAVNPLCQLHSEWNP